jgi:hypothetical protein
MAAKTLSSLMGVDQPRRKIVTLTASDASVDIPEWAQGGKGLVLVTGTAAGGSGGVYVGASSYRQSGGGAGAYATRHPIIIPSGETTLAVVIGAAGTGVSSSTATVNGNDASDTTLTIGSTVLLLGGGKGATSSVSAIAGGTPVMASAQYISVSGGNQLAPYGSQNQYVGMAAPTSTLAKGGDGARGDNAAFGYGAGAWSPWGRGGDGISAAPTATTNGDAPTGYGAGSAGARWVSGAAATTEDGAPAFLTLEFVEGY